MTEVQAVEIRLAVACSGACRYIPNMAARHRAVIRRYGQTLVTEGFFADLTELERYAADLSILAANEQRRDIAWRLGFGDDIMKESVRQTELSNWIASLVRT